MPLSPEPIARDTVDTGLTRTTPEVQSKVAPEAAPGAALLARVRDGLIGHRSTLHTPFGDRPLIYADYTASGRALDFIEDSIRNQVLPYYANTHTEASFSGAHSNQLRESARETIRRCVNGGRDDKVIFCGAGATAAINRLIDILGLRLPRDLDEQYALGGVIPAAQRPVVFVGPYEHHSNELPWRETIADVVRIPLDASGQIDLPALDDALARYRDRPLRIGSFSAASNVTGVRSDVDGITRRLKAAGALAFWDYAAAAPYVAIDVNRPGAEIDAVFVSPHKFIGGPGSPGLLIAKASLFGNRVPAVVGGGTVAYVSPVEHRYLTDIEHREEGGTPAIVESIRAGLAFALKDQIGCETIESREQVLIERALKTFATVPQIEILGPTDAPRLGIFSLRVRHGERDLHYGYVATLLNDLFGIQARGGCSCAGPYGHDLLGIDLEASRQMDQLVSRGYESFKPGWVRINCHFAATDDEVDYLLQALTLIARLGWRLLPSYHLDPHSGRWQHRECPDRATATIDDLLNAPHAATSEDPQPYPALLATAESLLRDGSPTAHRLAALREPVLPGDLETQRWFLTAREAAEQL